jgi:hypothetical protein
MAWHKPVYFHTLFVRAQRKDEEIFELHPCQVWRASMTNGQHRLWISLCTCKPWTISPRRGVSELLPLEKIYIAVALLSFLTGHGCHRLELLSILLWRLEFGWRATAS